MILAIEELHNNGIIFRDLKPENIVLDSDGHAMLTDFGLSKEGVQEGQILKSFCGSVAYLAPEMLKREGHTKSVDWYLLGVLLYEMLHGSPPYFSQNREQLFQNIRKAKLMIDKDLSEKVQDLLKKVTFKQLLIRNPAKRLGSGRRDAYEIKEHPFFEIVDWAAVLNRELKVPRPTVINRRLKRVGKDRMFGLLDGEDVGVKLDGWSFIDNSN